MGGDMPLVCEDCEYEDCPFGNKYEYCPKVCVAELCHKCRGHIGLVPGLVKYVVQGWDALYCCSKKCQQELQKEVDEEFKELSVGSRP